MKQNPHIKLIRRLSLLLVLAAFLGMGFSETVYAQTLDASCIPTSANNGFTTGLVYCVQTSIGTALVGSGPQIPGQTGGYIGALQTALKPYEGIMLAVAIAFFGIRLMNAHMQEPLKESMNFMLRILLGVYLYGQAGSIYTDLVGVPPNGSGIINEVMGWLVNPLSSFFSTQCANAPNAPAQYSGVQVWQTFDCMFTKIMSTVSPTTNSGPFVVSMLFIIGASLFSGTLGVGIFILGLTLVWGALMLVFRAIYLVLVSYLCIGFLALLTPLFAPLVFFESKFLTEKFKQWAALIISCIVQPIFVVGFLTMAVVVEDQFIEGQLPGCTLPKQIDSTSTTNNAPSTAGWGQDGSGVCSFWQLFNNVDSSAPDAQTAFNHMVEQSTVIFNQTVNASPQARSDNHTTVDPNADDDDQAAAANENANYANVGQNPGISPTNEQAARYGLNNVPHLKQYAPMRQFILSLLAFCLVTYAMYQLMDTIPEMASSITIATGISLASQLRVPFQEMGDNAINWLDETLSKKAEGTGIGPAIRDGLVGGKRSGGPPA